MTLTRNTDVLDFFDGDEKLVAKWATTSKKDWAALGGLHVTGLSMERDMGVTFGKDVADLSTTDLIFIRNTLADTFLKDDEDRGPYDEGTVNAVVVNLVQIVEAEIGGRWV